MIAKSETILSRAFSEDSAFFLFHDDADGCCAAAILLHLFNQKTTHGPLGFASPEKHSVELTPRLARRLRKESPHFIISLDLALTNSVEKINKLLNLLAARMLIYDHHIQSKSIEWPTRCVHVNPLNFNLGNIPASHYSYILHKHYTEKNCASWVAAIGVVADYRAEECRDLLEEVRHLYPSLYPFQTINQPTALKSPLMNMAHLVNAGYQHSDHQGAKIAVEALNEALQTGDPATLLEGKTKKALALHKYRKEVDEELRKSLDRFDSVAEFQLGSRLAFYLIKPRYNITSEIATQLQHSHPDTIIAVVSPETSKTMKISLRRGNRVQTNLSILAESSIAGLTQSSGGGHPDAAGCVIQNGDIDVWKKKVLRCLR
jgi:single-stranded DNA-specific DHH superfamily exonuclease